MLVPINMGLILNLDVCVQRIIEGQNNVVITDRMWARLLSSTNQPSFITAKDVIEDSREEEEPPKTPRTQTSDDNSTDDKLMVNKEMNEHAVIG